MSVDFFPVYKKIKMSAAACSNSASNIFALEGSEEDIMTHPNKRAKIEIASFEQLNLEKFSLVQVGKTKKDQKIYANIDGKPIRANLSPNDWLSTRFGFDTSGQYEKPSFLGGKAPERKGCPESLSLKVTLNSTQLDFIQKLDEAAQNAFAEISPGKWNPLIASGYSQIKVSVVLAGDGLTQLMVVKDGKVHRGEGFDFLKTFDGSFNNAQVKLVLRVRKVWQHTGKAGLSLEATQLCLKPTERPVEENVFADEDLLAD